MYLPLNMSSVLSEKSFSVYWKLCTKWHNIHTHRTLAYDAKINSHYVQLMDFIKITFVFWIIDSVRSLSARTASRTIENLHRISYQSQRAHSTHTERKNASTSMFISLSTVAGGWISSYSVTILRLYLPSVNKLKWNSKAHDLMFVNLVDSAIRNCVEN